MRLSRDRWYNGDGQREIASRARAESGGLRRLAGLVILLVMVIFCMLQLRNPRKYEAVFEAVGLTTDSDTEHREVQVALEQALQDTSGLDGTFSNSDTASYNFRIWRSLLSGLTVDQLNQVAATLFQIPATVSEDSSEFSTEQIKWTDWFALVDSQLATWQQHVADMPTDYMAALTSFEAEWAQFKTNPAASDTTTSGFARVLRLALDERLLRSVRDAATWGSADTMAFARTMQRANTARDFWLKLSDQQQKLLSRALPAFDLPLLVRQADQVRGRLASIRGSIAMSDNQVITKLSKIGEFSYQVIWLKPEQSSRTPICVYLMVTDGNPVKFSVDESRTVEFVAIPLKRLAYAAQSGIEVAPVLIGVAHQFDTDEQQSEAAGDFAFVKPLRDADPLLCPAKGLMQLLASQWNSPTEIVAHRLVVENLIVKPWRDIQAAASAEKWDNLPTQDDSDVLRALTALLNGMRRTETSVVQSLVTSIAPEVRRSRETGVVLAMETIPLPADLAEGVGFSALYKLDFQNRNGAQNAVYVADVPNDWKEQVALYQPAAFDLISLSESEGICAATRPRWVFPETAESMSQDWSPRVDNSLVSLGQSGFDLTLLNDVRSRQKQTIAHEEKYAFYSMLAHSEVVEGETGLSVVDCLKSPADSSGFPITGRARTVRVTRVTLEQEDLIKQLGGNYYFEINALADTGRQPIRLVDKDSGEELIFDREFPITILSRELPPGLMSTADKVSDETSEAWYVSSEIDFRGRFYRLWSFESDYQDKKVKQIAPLVMVPSLSLVPQVGDASSTHIVNLSFGIIGTLLIVAYAMARFFAARNSPKKKARTTN